MQDEKGTQLYRRYINRTDEGLLEREDHPGGARFFYDDSHTLRKVFRDGRWITEATLDYFYLGKPELEFPLQSGKSWSHQFPAKDASGNVFTLGEYSSTDD